MTPLQKLWPLSLSSECGRRFWKGKRVVLEGGSIDVNGMGSILTTEECLLSRIQARNPELTREDMEESSLTISARITLCGWETE